MNTFRLLGLTAVLGAGLVGLALTDVQAAQGGLGAGELKEINGFLNKVNSTIDGLLERVKDAKQEGLIIDTKFFRDALDTKAVKFDVPTLTLAQVQLLKANVNRQLKAAVKEGKLTELDRKLLATKNFAKGTPFAKKAKGN